MAYLSTDGLSHFWSKIKTFIQTHTNNSTIHVTSTDKSNWNAKMTDDGVILRRTSKSSGIGSTTKPVYIDNTGHAVETTYALNKTVPANAVFTDTVYTLPTASDSTLGGIKVGNNLSIDDNGVLSASGGNDNVLIVYGTTSMDYIDPFDKIVEVTDVTSTVSEIVNALWAKKFVVFSFYEDYYWDEPLLVPFSQTYYDGGMEVIFYLDNGFRTYKIWYEPSDQKWYAIMGHSKKIVCSTTDIGAGATLDSGTLYFVYS